MGCSIPRSLVRGQTERILECYNQAMVQFTITSDFPPGDGSPHNPQDSQELRFELFLKTRQIKELSQMMASLRLMPKRERRSWLREHEGMLQDQIDTLLEEIMGAFDQRELDSEVLAESIECVTELKNLMNTLQDLLSSEHQLQS